MKQERTTFLLTGADPVFLLDWFDRDVRDGINDELTKSCLYFFLNRYFDNGGNIYEIYDYVNSRPNLTFLRCADVLYPVIFQMILERILPSTASIISLLAYLAYSEALERNGYAGIALRGTAAHQYAQLAYITEQNPKILNSGINATQNILMKRNKALFFADAAQSDVVLIMEGQAHDIPIRDRVAGLRHYAVALRYFGFMGIKFHSLKTAQEIFTFCVKTIRENGMPELGPFTGLLDASTLLFDDKNGVEEVRKALQPILESEPNVWSGKKPVRRILLAKEETYRMSDYDASPLRRSEFGVFGKKNILNLAQKVPEFRIWLKDGGWMEADFEEGDEHGGGLSE